MDQQPLVKVSKYLTKHLRHRPERLGLRLDPGGWVDVDELLDACRRAQFSLSRDELAEVVERNDKRRFSLDDTGSRIRANQRHNLAIDLQLEAEVPPPLLYHGTWRLTVERVLGEGLQRMGRHHVHVTADVGTALKVGARHGRPTVLEVAARRLHDDGADLYRTDNAVWLTDHVPVTYLEVLS